MDEEDIEKEMKMCKSYSSGFDNKPSRSNENLWKKFKRLEQLKYLE